MYRFKKDIKFIMIPEKVYKELITGKYTKRELKFMLEIIDYTFGWKKPEDPTAISQFVKDTGIEERHVKRVKARLLKRNKIKINSGKISLKLDFDPWERVDDLATPPRVDEKTERVDDLATQKGGQIIPPPHTLPRLIPQKAFSKFELEKRNEEGLKHIKEVIEDLKSGKYEKK